jgi:phosphoribosyl 1,2-cyclic phosphodiesterase
MLAPSTVQLLDRVMHSDFRPAGHERAAGAADAAREDPLTVRFWGARGGIARSGRSTARFGGNTLCVTVELDKDRLFVFDAGTGMINFGKFIAERRKRHRFNLFISNPYWDHVQGLPYFEPLQLPGNEMVVHGIAGSELNVRHVIAAQRSNPYLPVIGRERASRVHYRDLGEGDFEIDQLQVSTIGLNHPGPALGYRLTSPTGKTVAYVTGNEVFSHGSGAPAARERLVSFLQGVDILIHDATYFDNEYRSRVGSGHSSVSAVLTLASEARVKRLYLFHHDPSHDDEAIGKMEMIARYFFEQRRLGIQCWAAREGAAVTI